MDIYQIIATQFRVWTVREIVCFTLIFFVAVVGACFLVHKKKIIPLQAVSGLVLFAFLGVVFASTVFTRVPDGVHHYELQPFWSWKKVYQGDSELLIDNLLNIIMLLPMGVLLPYVFRKKLPWWQGLLAGVIVSAGIEICQLILCRGLFEWDDMIHNGLGCMVGCVISGFVMKERDRG